MSEIDTAVRLAAADEAATATLLREKAAELDRNRDFDKASVYYDAAVKADDRAGVWRGLLR